MSPITTPRCGFNTDARLALGNVQSAISALLNALPAVSRRPSELTRCLKLDKSLASKLIRFTVASDPLSVSKLLPGDEGMEIVVRAARKAGVGDEILERIRESIQRMSEVVREHAGDRGTFDLMAEASMPGSDSDAPLELRRASFQGNSFTWGVQARVQYKAGILHESREEDLIDCVSIRGFIGFRRMRPGTRWTIARTASYTQASGLLSPGLRRRPLDDEGAADYAPVLHQFCTSPVPRVERVPAPDGRVDEQLPEGPVGNKGALTILSGELIYGLGPLWRTQSETYAATSSILHTPCELYIADLLVQAGLYGPQTPAFHLYNSLGVPPWPLCGESARMTLGAAVIPLGRGLEVVRSPEVPRCDELLRFALDRAGWSASDFDVYRVRLPYPPIPTVAVLRLELPDRPTSLDPAAGVRRAEPGGMAAGD